MSSRYPTRLEPMQALPYQDADVAQRTLVQLQEISCAIMSINYNFYTFIIYAHLNYP
jgi:hypothetical protein